MVLRVPRDVRRAGGRDQGGCEGQVAAPPGGVRADSGGFRGGNGHVVVLPAAGEQRGICEGDRGMQGSGQTSISMALDS